MKHDPSRRRVQVLLPADLYDRLVKTSAASGDTLTRYIARAIRERLDGATDKAQFFRRLDRHTDAQARTQHDIELLQEALGLFVRFWLAHTPSLPNNAKRAAWKTADARYKQFIAHLAQRFCGGHRFVEDFPPESIEDPGEVDPGLDVGDLLAPELESKK